MAHAHRKTKPEATEPNPVSAPTEHPPLPSNIGKTKALTYIDGSTTTYTIIDEIRRIPPRNPGKALYLQMLQFADDGRKEMRFCYYMIAHRPRMKGR